MLLRLLRNPFCSSISLPFASHQELILLLKWNKRHLYIADASDIPATMGLTGLLYSTKM